MDSIQSIQTPKKRGRPTIPIEIKKKNKKEWMLNSIWYCDICNNGINYRLTGKFNHLKTQMHKKYVEIQKLKAKN